MTHTIKYTLAFLIAAVAFAVLSYTFMPASASTPQQDSYKAYNVRSQQIGTTTLKAANGQIGSIIIASTSPAQATSSIAFYDTAGTATTSSATTSFLFSIPGNSMAVGTYTFDVEFTRGLLVETTAGFNGQFIVTYK